MSSVIYDKTDKGREEIATRKHGVPPRLRTLLVMIDGNLALDTLLKNFAGLGVTEDSINELLHQDYIVKVGGGEEPPAPVTEPMRAPASSAKARMAARRAGPSSILGPSSVLREEDPPTMPMDAAVQTSAPPAPAAAAPLPRVAAVPADDKPVPIPNKDADNFRHLYDFYNQTIKSTIGLRGIMLQLKVEKCNTIEDFRELRLPYLEAVLKAKGSEMAKSMRGRLDQLLGGKPDNDPFVVEED